MTRVSRGLSIRHPVTISPHRRHCTRTTTVIDPTVWHETEHTTTSHKGTSVALKTRRNDLLSTAERIPQILLRCRLSQVASRAWLVLGYPSNTYQNNCSSPPRQIWLQSSVFANCSELAVSSAHSLGCSRLFKVYSRTRNYIFPSRLAHSP